METANASRVVVYCVGCGVVEEKQTTGHDAHFELAGFDVVVAWRRHGPFVCAARCRKCNLSAHVQQRQA